jgi:hypothetical protein
MDTQASNSASIADITVLINKEIRIWNKSYYTWYIIFISLSLLSIALPLIIASDLVPAHTTNRILALITAVCVGVLGWGNIGAAAGKFDQARTTLKVALASFPNDHSKLVDAYRAAMIVVQGNGPITPPAQHTG